MKAVDRMNQRVKSLNLKRSSERHYRKLSIYMVEIILHNLFILLSDECKKEHQNKFDYIHDLAINLLGRYDKNLDQVESHFCEISEKRERCRVCYKKGRSITIHHKCVSCRGFHTREYVTTNITKIGKLFQFVSNIIDFLAQNIFFSMYHYCNISDVTQMSHSGILQI